MGNIETACRVCSGKTGMVDTPFEQGLKYPDDMYGYLGMARYREEQGFEIIAS
jgi:hypothetical protein